MAPLTHDKRDPAGILFGDMKGSTEAAEYDEERAVEALREYHRVIEEIARSHNPAFFKIKAEGDGFMSLFINAHVMVECGFALKEEFEKRGWRVRLGGHYGEAFPDESGDMLGADVNRTARIAGAADASIVQFFVSDTVQSIVRNRIKEVDIKPYGRVEAKGVEGGLKVYEVVRLGQPGQRERLLESYRQHIIDKHGKLTLYSVHSDKPLAVDLERVYVKLKTTTQKKIEPEFREGLRVEDIEMTSPPGAELTDIYRQRMGRVGRRRGQASLEPQMRTTTVERTLSLTAALREHLHLVVVGAPGSGKTTLLRYLALTYARQEVNSRLELKEELLPIFVSLRDFSRFLDNLAQKGQLLDIGPNLLFECVHEHLSTIAPWLNLPKDFFLRRLEKGEGVILLDGLDEVADLTKRQRVAEAVTESLNAYRKNRFILTSRPYGYEKEVRQRIAASCADCTIRDFDSQDIKDFAHGWYAAVTVDRLGDTPDARKEAEQRAEDLVRAVHADPRVERLATNPLLLSVLAMVHQRDVVLPQRRAELYEECIEMLLGYWDQVKGGEAARELATYGELSRSEKRALLEPIALWFHERGQEGLQADAEELKEQIAKQFEDLMGDDASKAKRRAELFLRVIEERAGLLVERETGVYAFSHLTFQEYLAARAISDREDYIEYTLQHLHHPWWQEAILLEVGHLSTPNTRRARKLTTDTRYTKLIVLMTRFFGAIFYLPLVFWRMSARLGSMSSCEVNFLTTSFNSGGRHRLSRYAPEFMKLGQQ